MKTFYQRNFYVPPVIFRTCAFLIVALTYPGIGYISDEDGGTPTRICIDGKQRLTSIKRFMDGLIP